MVSVGTVSRWMVSIQLHIQNISRSFTRLYSGITADVS